MKQRVAIVAFSTILCPSTGLCSPLNFAIKAVAIVEERLILFKKCENALKDQCNYIRPCDLSQDFL